MPEALKSVTTIFVKLVGSSYCSITDTSDIFMIFCIYSPPRSSFGGCCDFRDSRENSVVHFSEKCNTKKLLVSKIGLADACCVENY